MAVTSDKEGIAMRSQALDLGDIPTHRPGTLIGKALEPPDKGVREIGASEFAVAALEILLR